MYFDKNEKGKKKKILVTWFSRVSCKVVYNSSGVFLVTHAPEFALLLIGAARVSESIKNSPTPRRADADGNIVIRLRPAAQFPLDTAEPDGRPTVHGTCYEADRRRTPAATRPIIRTYYIVYKLYTGCPLTTRYACVCWNAIHSRGQQNERHWRRRR